MYLSKKTHEKTSTVFASSSSIINLIISAAQVFTVIWKRSRVPITQDGGSSTQFQSPIDDRFSGNAFQWTVLARGVAQVKERIDRAIVYRLSIGDEYTLVLLPCDSIQFPLTTATKHPHRFWLFTFLYAILFKQVLVSTLRCILSICIEVCVRVCVLLNAAANICMQRVSREITAMFTCECRCLHGAKGRSHKA